jgi:hypothetical protein
MSSFLERHEERMRALVEPLREEEREIDARIAALEEELATLRPVRTEVRRQIRFLTGAPTVNSNGKPRAKPTPSKGAGSHGGIGISEERLVQVSEWLAAHRADYPDGFVGSEISRAPTFPVKGGQTQAAKALRVLRDRGVVVLDRVDPSRRTKYYKLPGGSP